MFNFYCSSCRQELQAEDEWNGMTTECPVCHAAITIVKEDAAYANVSESHANHPASATFDFLCPSCGTFAQLNRRLKGKEYICPACGETAIATEAKEKTCPFCGETIKYNAVICRFCHRQLPPRNNNQAFSMTGRTGEYANSARTNGFVQIIKESKTLIPEISVFLVVLLSFMIYIKLLMDGIQKFNNQTARLMNHIGEHMYSPWADILKFSVPVGGAEHYEYRLLTILWVLLGMAGCYFVISLLNRSAFRKIQLIASSICLGLTLIIVAIMDCHNLMLPLEILNCTGYDDFDTSYSHSTLFYVLFLVLCTIVCSVVMKYRFYQKTISNGENIDFIDFIKKFLKWELV